MHKDATGRLIVRGAYIAYSAGIGSGVSGIKFGRVVKLKEKGVERSRYNTTTLGYDDFIETSYSIQIISVEQQWKIPPGGKYDDGKYEWSIQGKKDGRLAKVQSIERLDRVIVLEPDQMQPDAKDIIDKEMHERGST